MAKVASRSLTALKSNDLLVAKGSLKVASEHAVTGVQNPDTCYEMNLSSHPSALEKNTKKFFEARRHGEMV